MNHIKNQFIFYLKTVLLLVILFFVSFVLLKLPALAQDFSYHEFADQRSYFGIPNFFNVASNAFFCLIGLWGFLTLIVQRDPLWRTGEKSLALLFTLALILTGLGSAYYHLNPSHYTLVYDRIAISLAFTSFFSYLITERLFHKLGLILSPLFIALGIFTVIYWYQTELLGIGDLRPYLLVQIVPLLALLLIPLLFPSPRRYDAYLYITFFLYLVAFAFELIDAPLFAVTKNSVSGHTLKHLAAALGAIFLITYLIRKKPTLE